ncbi:MAG: beta-agarase [Planctomycetota bacterium]|nr:beta-agarase [Planctomycetota bacterium]
MSRHPVMCGVVVLACFALLAGVVTGQDDAPAFDKYGGWTKLKCEPTGFFSVRKIDDRWWLVTPDGNVFFSTGVCGVYSTGNHCPALGHAPYGKAVADKYAKKEDWAKTTLARLQEWGFNTLGAWSESALFAGQIPWTRILDLGVRGGANWLTGEFPDVFDPKFAATVDAAAEDACGRLKDDPWLVGYFLDNELRWGRDWRAIKPLFADFMALPPTAPGKKALIEFLRSEYADDIEKFRQAWKSDAASFEELASARSLAGRPDGKSQAEAQRVKESFAGIVADRYFQVTTSAVRRYDPNHLVLGVRFSSAGACEAVIRACGKYCDVLSINFYHVGDVLDRLACNFTDGLTTAGWLAEYHRVSTRPVMITEFSFKAMDSGLPNSRGASIPVRTQADRAGCFRSYARACAEKPYMVGYHWFEYIDQPALGRSDGENSNYGLVNEKDEPWETLTAEMKRTNREVYKLHRGSGQAEKKGQ